MSKVTGIISALNNYSSIAPIVTKDLVENAGTTTMAYVNAGDDTRTHETTEKFVETNSASLLWYGAIPFIKKVFNLTAFKKAKLNPDVSLEVLAKDKTSQNVDDIIKKIDNGELPSKMKITKGFFKKTTEIVDTKQVLLNVKNNAKKFKHLHVARLITSTLIPTLLSAIALPKAIIALTEYNVQRNLKKKQETEARKHQLVPKQVAFSGIQDRLVSKAALAQKSLLADMVAVDLAISGSRVYYANKREQEALQGRKTNAPYAAALEKAIREGGFLYLIYFGGNHIKGFIDKLTKNKFDPIVLEDKNFIKNLSDNKLKVNPIKNMSEKEALDYIDKNINNESEIFVDYAKKMKLIKTVENENGKTFRNPIKFLNVENLSKVFDDMIESGNDFLKNGASDLEKYIKKKAMIKRVGVIGNLAVSSFAVCYLLPKAMYAFRKWYTGSNEEPGIAHVIEKASIQNK